MSSNPLEEDHDREQRIRERAYHLWKSEGEPTGAELNYWERARELIALEDSMGAGQLSINSAQANFGNGGIVEEAFIQENLGEFPARLSDQGERAQTPLASQRFVAG